MPTGQAAIRAVSAREYVAAQRRSRQLQRQGGSGALLIPAKGVHIQLPIFGTMTNETLAAGVAQYFTNRPFGQGNTVLAAHNFAGADVLLGRIKALKTGDRVFVTDYQHVYAYAVVDNRVVKETETQVLAQTEESRVTLIRCEGPAGTKFCRVVVARRVKVTAAERRQALATGRLTPAQQRLLWLQKQPWYAAFTELYLTGRVSGWLWGALIVFLITLAVGGWGFGRGQPNEAK